MKYTGDIDYIQDSELAKATPAVFDAHPDTPAKFDDGNPVYSRACQDFNQSAYMYPAPPVFMGPADIPFPDKSIYVLRLLIKMPGSAFMLPAKIAFMKDFIAGCAAYQKAHFPDYDDRFVYLTVRSGAVKSVKDDSYHVDGFQGISVPRHIPEQNYIWADTHPTMFALQPYFMAQLDPAIHNMQDFLHANTDPENIYQAQEKGLYIIDPYHVHARPPVPEGLKRAFLRVCFSPVEIRDDTNTPNPFLPRGPYNRQDIRNILDNPCAQYSNASNCGRHGLRKLTA